MKGKLNLFNEDCMPALEKMDDNQFDLAIVDPPYGIKKDGQKKTTGGHGGRKEHAQKDWDSAPPSDKYFRHIFRVSRNQIIWGANYYPHQLFSSMGWIFWDKGQTLRQSDGELAFTSFDRALKRIIMNRVELLIEGAIHPTQKPAKLYKWLLKNYAKEGNTILDTHLGSGSIAIACYDMGFDLTGYEIDKDYFEAMEKRIKQHTDQLTMI